MPEQPENLRRRVEALAMRTVLEEPPSPQVAARLSADLTEISREADRAGCPETARAAAALAAALLEPGGAELGPGVAGIQQALEEESRSAAAPVNPLAQDPELIRDFVVEAREHLASVEAQALVLEQDPDNAEAVHSLFRSFHTIKGLAGFLDFAFIQEVAHEVETLLDVARNGRLIIRPAVIDVILESGDWLAVAIKAVEAGGPAAEPPSGLLARIAGAGEQESAAPSGPQAKPEESAAPQPAREAAARKVEHFSVRVDAAKLDYLMDMVGEMVIAQSLVRHDPALEQAGSSNLVRNISQLARITTEVQRTAMAMRMIPIGQLFQRTARLARDLSRKAAKPVEMHLSGEDTELDKTIAEELTDPLLHMVRNSIDHGVESAEERAAAGKPAAGQMRLAAFHHGGQIVIEVADDGRGLNREKILRKARERGLAGPEGLADAEVYNLIFEPGFSTAEQVTDVSGRGVGMDVVRKQVQKLRGRIDIETAPGKGTTFSIKLPLTLAIIDGLVVALGAYRYIVPIFAVREVFRPAPDAVFTLEGRDEMVMVHERLLPLVRLHRRFNLEARHQNPCEAVLIVCDAEGKVFCLMVDELIGKQEVVIKSLGERLKNIPGVAGGTILGDGRVGLILEMNGIFGGSNGD